MSGSIVEMTKYAIPLLPRGGRRWREAPDEGPGPRLPSSVVASRSHLLPLGGRRVSSARRLQPCGAAGFGEFAHAQDVALALGDGDDAARVEKVEGVARLDALIVGGQRHQMPAA